MQEYAARVCSDGRVQTVKEHTVGVWEKAESDAALMGVASIAKLVCLLHDMGKNTAYSNEYQHTVGVGNTWAGERPIHSHAGAKLIDERYFQVESKSSPLVVLLSELAETVIMSHHGLFDCLKPALAKGDFNGLIKKIHHDDYDFNEASELFFAQIAKPEELDAVFESAIAEAQKLYTVIRRMTSKKDEFFFYLSMIYRMLLSILVNADHADAAEFSLQEKIACASGDAELWQRCSAYLEEKLAAFEIKTPLQAVRSEISRKLLEKSDKQQTVIRLSVPTGGGKTLGSLRYAVNYAERFHKSRIVYVAPFNSILEQNSAEYRRVLPGDVELLEHFGDLIDDENENYRYYTENWGSPIIATSMVQFLNTLFLGKITSVRRMRGLIDSVIILDEIQSVPVECISLFNLGINFLTEICDCTVVLCSATQPTFDSEIKHQIRISQNSELLDDRAEYAEKFRRTKVVDALRPKGYTYDETAEFVLHTAKESNSVLLIVNTKEASKTIYSIIKERLPDGFEAVHLSTHMCPAHRKAALSELRERLHSGEKVICVSTQLIEAGVDISFETVIRSLAGLDSIIQSAGRCNRNRETDLGSVYVINISDENISRIKTIRIGAAITRRLMETMRKTPTLFHGDITCEAAVSKYYRDYFKEAENELDYNVSAGDLHTTMFQLLSVNTEVKKRAEAYGDRNFNQCFNQSFKTAGEAFQVIEEYANSVVVPFGEGKKLIEALCSEKLSARTPELLRQLGHYSIGLSDRQCEGRVERNEKTGVLILKDGYYNSEYGFDPDGSFGTLLF